MPRYGYGARGPRYLGLCLVVLLHLGVIYGLVVGLSRKTVRISPHPIETEIVEEVPARKPLPEPPPPELEMPSAPFVPPPEIVIREQPPEESAAISHVSPEAAPREPVPKPRRTPPQINASSHCPKPDYPSLSLRLGERGTVVLEFLVGTDGRVKRSRVESSSGYPRLDEAARRALSRCRFVPGTVNGRPTRSWAKLQYTWRIPD